MNKAGAERLLASIQKAGGVDGYTVRDVLGFGGSAAVFEATAADGTPAALKLYESRFLDQAQRLERELSLTGHDCPSLVKIFGGGKATIDDEHFIYIAMDRVDGEDLSALIASGERFDDPTIRRHLLQLHAAAAYLLEKRMCHRDIKPANIRVRPNGDLVLLDLGVLRPIDGSDLTEGDDGRRFIATLRYTPPELVHMKDDPPPEIWEAITSYQIGAVLYEMIQGTKLFAAVKDHPTADLIQAVDTFTPQLVRSDIGQDLVLMCRRCLVKDPETRRNRASMALIAACASSPAPSPAPAANVTLDKHFQHAADANQEIERLQVQRIEKQKARMVTWQAACSVANAGLRTLGAAPFEFQIAVHNGPGVGPEEAAYIVLVNDDLKKGLVGDLRIAILVRPNTSVEVANVRGIAFRGGPMPGLEETCKVIFQSNLADALETIWDDVYEEAALRAKVERWVSDIATIHITATKALYDSRIADAKRREEAFAAGGRSFFGTPESLKCFAFTTTLAPRRVTGATGARW